MFGGLLKEGGTASIADARKPSDAAEIRAFIVDGAQRSRRENPSALRIPRQ